MQTKFSKEESINKIKVTIVIPVYNGAEFIRRCFDSCVYQTLKEIEIIAVGDDSPDSRDAIIMQEYERMYPGKFRALFHEKRKCQGGARNTGICAARGEYFLCIDQDDYIDLNMCEKMYKEALENKSDLCVCGYKVYSHGIISTIPPVICTFENVNRYMPVIWKMLIQTSFIKTSEAYFPEQVVSDDIVSLLWFALTDRCCMVDDVYYHYIRYRYSESMNPKYRLFASVPETFIVISSYRAFKNLSEEKKELLVLFMTRSLCDAIMSCAKYYPGRLRELCSKINKVIEIYRPSFSHEVFHSTTYGIRYSAILQYVTKHYNEIDFVDEFEKFSSSLIKSLIKKEISMKNKGGAALTIYGVGIRGKRLAEYLISADIPFEVTDSNPFLYGQEFCGKTVKPWSELKKFTNVVICTPWGGYNEIKMLINDSNIQVLEMDIF